MSRLLRYESERQAHSAVMCAVTDGLNKLYSTNAKPIVIMRSIGMQLASSNQQIKVWCNFVILVRPLVNDLFAGNFNETRNGITRLPNAAESVCSAVGARTLQLSFPAAIKDVYF